MMATLLEVKGFIKRFYERYDVYVKPVLKFILALINFLLMNTKVGFMQQLRNPLIAVVLALICAFLPLNATVLIAGAVLVAHAYALSLEVCAVTAGLLAVMYLLYFRISAKYAIILITKVLPKDKALDMLRESITNKFSKKGTEVVNQNIKAIEDVENNIKEIEINPEWINLEIKEKELNGVLDCISHLKEDELKVSDFIKHDDGTYEVNTSKLEKRNIAEMLPCWNTEKCITCNQCVMACPHAVIRPKLMTMEEVEKNPGIIYKDVPGSDMKFALEISYDD